MIETTLVQTQTYNYDVERGVGLQSYVLIVHRVLAEMQISIAHAYAYKLLYRTIDANTK